MAASYESAEVGIKKSFALSSPTSLAFVESLTLPLVRSVEMIPTSDLVQEVVISADVRCKECQKRITAVISRMNAETESVVVNVMEKKVTFICKNPKIIPPDQKQITAAFKNPLAKISLFRIIFCSSGGH
ncbi:hypothetical protein V2J09_004114 [Rumex salicifolius]